MDETGGGAKIDGNVTVERGDFVGRDKITITEAVAYDVAGLPNPYLGLRAFTFDDRAAFAGREAKAAETVAALTDPGAPKTLLFITGASGCGKSSFAQAGLLPKLHAHYAQRQRAVRHAVFRPSRDPMAGLRDAFVQLGAEGAERSPRPTQPRTPAGQVNLIVIDQFEECFTQSDPAARDALFRWLAALPAFDAANTHMIVTLRSDYLNELFEQPALWEIAKRDGVELRAMGEAELREAIQRPLQARQTDDARYVGKRFEPALVDRLANDAAASAAYLPLLQVTLEDRWDKGKLILSNYGSLTDAIRQRAEQVFAFADFDRADPQVRRTPEAQAALLGIFLELIEVSADDDPRRDVRRRREKVQLTQGDPARAALVDELARARLLSISADADVESVDIIHESLIANWDWLREAVAASRRQLRQRGRFEQQLRWWQSNAQAEGDLLSGVALAEARELDAAGDVALRAPEAQDYLKRSIALEQAEQQRELEAARKLAEAEAKRAQEQQRANARLRTRNVVLAAASVIAAAFAITAFVLATQSNTNAARAEANAVTAASEANRANANAATAQAASTAAVSEANRANAQAEIALARQLSAQSSADAVRNPVRAALLGIEAQQTVPGLDMLTGLLTTLQTNLRAISAVPAHESTVTIVAFSPDGQTLASASDDKTIRLWDVGDPKQPKPLGEPLRGHKSSVNSVAFSSDSKMLASSGGTAIWLWDISDVRQPKLLGEPLRVYESYELGPPVTGVAFSPDGKTLASSGSWDKTVRLWDISDVRQPKPLSEPLRGHESGVNSVAFSRDGKMLASSSQDMTIWLWDIGDVQQPKPLGEPLHGHGHWVMSVVFSPDGKTLASGSLDETVRLWDISDVQQPKSLGEPLHGHESSVTSVAFSPDSKTLASSGGTIRLWDISDIRQPKPLGEPLRGHESSVTSVAFSSDGRTLVSGSDDKSVRLWDISDVQQPKPLGEPLRGHESRVNSVAFSPDGKTLASAEGGFSNTIRLWNISDVRRPKPLDEPLRGHETELCGVAFSPDGKTLASSGGTIRLWDISDIRQPKPLSEPLRGHESGVCGVAFSPDGRTLASGSDDKSVRLWDISDVQQPKPLGEPLRGHESGVNSVAFSPDGRTLASGSYDETIRLWDISGVRQPKPLGEPLRGHEFSVNSVAFSPDGKTLASGSDDKSVRLWDISDVRQPKPLSEPLRGHESGVNSVAFSPDGKTLASGGGTTIRLWDISDVRQPKPLGEPLRGHESGVNSVAFSPDGRTLASGSGYHLVRSADNTVRLWDVDVEHWVVHACRIAGRNLTQAEWRFYLPDTPYRKTCPQWPAGE